MAAANAVFDAYLDEARGVAVITITDDAVKASVEYEDGMILDAIINGLGEIRERMRAKEIWAPVPSRPSA